jgi:hypothetical protein
MLMKKMIGAVIPVFIVLIIAAGNLYAQDNFQGKMVFEISEESGSTVQQLEYLSNGSNIRIDMAMEGMKSSVLMRNDKLYMIMHPMKMYMEMPKNFEMDEEDLAEFENDFVNNITKTNETKDILGYTCYKWIAKDDNEKVEIWVTEELGSFMFPENIDQGEAPFWTKAFGDNFFPLQLTEFDQEGNPVSNFEVIDIDEMEVKDTEFVIPSGYQKMDGADF